ncbi:armadillo-type protein [Mycena amicta]|nr:armadillo-type protein [Mycena amicta]
MASDIQAVLAAIDVFGRAPDKASLDQANNWLQDFQHSPDAWATCNVLLLTPDTPPSAKLFAAQTFRAKVTYDLSQVDPANLPGFRDTLVAALENHHTGPRTIIVQLCLAIAGLALQFPAWSPMAVQFMITHFGRNPSTVPALLQFLTILPEEVNNNHRIPITDDDYSERVNQLLTANSKQVLELLALYLQAQGVTRSVQSQVFRCLRNWLIAGEVQVTDLVKSPLFVFTFEALASDELFDPAVDVICELIHETQEIDDNMSAIELIVPRLIALKPQLVQQHEDPDKIRGYARIFSEAGETYRSLILQHPETFFQIVEAIGECSAYSDLDIVPITFPFWMRFAQVIGKRPSVSPLFLDAYRALMGVIINHLHFPADATPLTGQEADDFRSFRHVMGDTLKDCCLVLKTNTCLLAAYQMITIALSRSPGAVSWQEIEAPLFAMRSIGAEIDVMDDEAVPKIINLIPSLPDHPRVRYAALLIIARYTEWINRHPEYLAVQLQYVSAGFEAADAEVASAAGQALKYLCQDCKEHLVDFLPQLHTFLSSTGTKLLQDDRRQVYEAIAYVISAMPMARAAESLRTFSVDILAQIHAITLKPNTPTKEELQAKSDALENLEVMLRIVQGFGEELPPACQSSCEEAWTVLNAFLSKYGNDYEASERTTRVIRYGITLFGDAALPVVSSAVARMSFSFEATGYPSYLWIAGKIIHRYGNEENEDLRGSFREVYERSTNAIVSLLQTRSATEIPDVMEDYLRMLNSMVPVIPDIFFESSAFPLAFRAAMEALMLVHTDIVFASLDLFVLILTHDCLNPAPSTPPPPKYLAYAAVIQDTVQKDGLQFLCYLISGLVGEFPEDSLSLVVSIFRAMALVWGSQLLSWLPSVLQQLPSSAAPQAAQAQFLSDVTRAVTEKEHDKVKYALLSLNRASRKARERRRVGVLDR